MFSFKYNTYFMYTFGIFSENLFAWPKCSLLYDFISFKFNEYPAIAIQNGRIDIY